MGQMVGAGAEIFDKLEPEPHKNGPAPQHCLSIRVQTGEKIVSVPVLKLILFVRYSIKSELSVYDLCNWVM
jgi:hypothetical protein